MAAAHLTEPLAAVVWASNLCKGADHIDEVRRGGCRVRRRLLELGAQLLSQQHRLLICRLLGDWESAADCDAEAR